jgi:hypothetical protein
MQPCLWKHHRICTSSGASRLWRHLSDSFAPFICDEHASWPHDPPYPPPWSCLSVLWRGCAATSARQLYDLPTRTNCGNAGNRFIRRYCFYYASAISGLHALFYEIMCVCMYLCTYVCMNACMVCTYVSSKSVLHFPIYNSISLMITKTKVII